MLLKEHVYSVLMVSSSDKFKEQICPLLSEATYSPLDFAGSVNEAQRKLTERQYDLIIINTPLPDDIGLRLAIDASSDKTSVVLLFIKSELYSEVYEKTFGFGVYSIRKPAYTQSILQALDWVKTTKERLKRLEKKTLSLQDKMEEIKIVNRAKWVLINSLNMTEADAHRYIEKQAMDRCISKKEVAENIIQTYK